MNNKTNPNDKTLGTVKWFSPAKGYGYIITSDGVADSAPEYFAHYSKISGDGYRNLDPGQHVRFIPCDGPKGPYADQIERLSIWE